MGVSTREKGVRAERSVANLFLVLCRVYNLGQFVELLNHALSELALSSTKPLVLPPVRRKNVMCNEHRIRIFFVLWATNTSLVVGDVQRSVFFVESVNQSTEFFAIHSPSIDHCRVFLFFARVPASRALRPNLLELVERLGGGLALTCHSHFNVHNLRLHLWGQDAVHAEHLLGIEELKQVVVAERVRRHFLSLAAHGSHPMGLLHPLLAFIGQGQEGILQHVENAVLEFFQRRITAQDELAN
mmetsp:Transcript_53047/g.105258  ORF Transcript_53047/g.105258 Transcript_53047/m.105258 type:complete len:243 (+) Transcript_53047:394-1122(+)